MKNNINENKNIKIIITILLAVLVSITLFSTYLSNKVTDSEKKFKKEYESLNGKTSKSGKEYRSVVIPEDNNIEITTLKNINKMIDNKETFYVYFGFEGCPWCRSVIEKMIEVSKTNNINKMYYVDVRPGVDDEKNDIRDEYDIDSDGNIYLSRKGTNEYHAFLKKAYNVLNDYSHADIKSLDNTKFEGAKRLGAPNIIYFKNGVAKKLTTGISDKEKDPFMKLTNKILKDEEDKFNEIFKNK